MAAKKRFVAKLFGLTTVLAAGGAGVYSYTSGGAPWTWLARHDGDQVAQSTLRMDDAPPFGASKSSDLDAVASAWAQSSSSQHADSTEASPSARSAGVTLSRAESEPISAVGSRYSEPQPLAVHSDETNSAESAAEFEPERNQPPTTPDFEPTVDPIAMAEPAPLARGQDAPAAQAASAEAAPIVMSETSDPTHSNMAADGFRFPAEAAHASPEQNAASARARQAFSEPLTGNAPPTAAGRYGPTNAAPNGADTAPLGGANVNPFGMPAAQPANTIAGNSQSASSNATLPPPDNGQFNSAASGISSAYDQSPQGDRLAPIDFRAAPTEYSGQNGLSSADTASASGGTFPLGASPLGANGQSGPEGAGRPGERALEGAQNPALVIQKLAPAEIQVNKPAKFIVQVRNVGGQAATDVVVQDMVPQGTRLLSTSPAADVNGGQLMWRVGTLSIGEERSLEMQLMPVSEGEIGSVATVTYSAQASVKTLATMPQLAIRMTSPPQVMVGQEHRVKIFLHNPGSGDATGVMLFENVPENVRHAAGAALEFEIGTLRAGETRELELVLLAEKPGKVKNVLSARAEGNLQVQQEVEFEVIAPGLSVAIVGPDRRYLERPATYEVRVENPGTAPARDIQLVTKLPKGLKFVSANNMGEYDAGTHAVYWNLAELPEGEHGSVELVAMPIEAGSQTLEVEGRAQQGLSDQTKHPILIEGLAAIMFEVRDLEDPIEVGRETGYEVRVVNQGTKAASNVQISVAIPPGMQVISAEGETRHTVQPNGIVFAPIRQLAPKADTVYRLKVLCQQPGDQRVTVEVKTDDLQPIRREESTRVFGDE